MDFSVEGVMGGLGLEKLPRRLAIPCCLLLISFYVVLEIAKKSFATTVSAASYDEWSVLRSSMDRVEIGDLSVDYDGDPGS